MGFIERKMIYINLKSYITMANPVIPKLSRIENDNEGTLK